MEELKIVIDNYEIYSYMLICDKKYKKSRAFSLIFLI
jgi:hypothetical protein